MKIEIKLTFNDNSTKITNCASLEDAKSLFLNNWVLVNLNPRIIKKCVSVSV